MTEGLLDPNKLLQPTQLHKDTGPHLKTAPHIYPLKTKLQDRFKELLQ